MGIMRPCFHIVLSTRLNYLKRLFCYFSFVPGVCYLLVFRQNFLFFASYVCCFNLILHNQHQCEKFCLELLLIDVSTERTFHKSCLEFKLANDSPVISSTFIIMCS